MQERHHRPVRVPSGAFDAIKGANDPAEVRRVAHDTAAALLHRARDSNDPVIVARIMTFTDEHGIDDLAELWSGASAVSLPGALWRLYLIREAARRNADVTSYTFRRGFDRDQTISHVVAGAVTPTGPDEIVALCDEILHGAFTGDVAIAFERASAFCRIMSQGAADIAESSETSDHERAVAWTRRGSRYLAMAEDLHGAAQQWTDGMLQ